MREVIAEALREGGACAHVSNPTLPTVLYGADAEALRVAVDALADDAEGAEDSIGRALRKDAQIMLAGVACFPVPVDDLKSSASDYIRWRGRVLAFLQDEYGASLVSVLQHLDEEYPHLHFIVHAPKNGLLLDLGELHQGRWAARNRKLPASERRRLYRDAMQGYQSRFFEKVGKPSGMTRNGPKRRRLTRAQWKSEQEAAAVLAEVDNLRNAVTEKDELLKESLAEIGRLQNEYALTTARRADESSRPPESVHRPIHFRRTPSPF
jgi:hypothetical protein